MVGRDKGMGRMVITQRSWVSMMAASGGRESLKTEEEGRARAHRKSAQKRNTHSWEVLSGSSESLDDIGGGERALESQEGDRAMGDDIAW